MPLQTLHLFCREKILKLYDHKNYVGKTVHFLKLLRCLRENKITTRSLWKTYTCITLDLLLQMGGRGVGGLNLQPPTPCISSSHPFFLGFLTYASVNSTCAQPRPGLTPGHWHFFCLGWQIPRGGDSWAVKSPGVGTKKEGKFFVLCQHCNIFHWSHSQIVPF